MTRAGGAAAQMLDLGSAGDTDTGARVLVLDELLNEACREPVDDDEAARLLLAEISDAEWRAVMLPLVARAVATRRLKARLSHPGSASGSGRPRGTGREVKVVAGGYEPNVAELRRMVNERFRPARDEPEVTWGQATVAHHERRMVTLGLLQEEVSRTVRRHEKALSVIRQAPGARCLADVFDRRRP